MTDPSATETGMGTDTGSASEGSVTGTTGALEPCDVQNATVEPIPPNIMFVLDKSGSMYTNSWDHDADAMTPNITRWHSLYNVVEFVVNNFDMQINFGAKLYPRYNCSSCCSVDPVEVPVAPMNGANVLAGIPGPLVAVSGNTPMETGIKLAVAYMQTLDPMVPRALLLVADGAVSSCNNESFADALTAVTDAENVDGIHTYVVGIDASGTTATQLNQLATAGGKPNPNGPPSFYQTTNQLELQQAMNDIVNSTLSCVLPIDPVPTEPDLLEVWIDGSEIPLVTDCATEDGWVWTQQYNEIELCGTACDMLKNVGSVEAKYFCTPG